RPRPGCWRRREASRRTPTKPEPRPRRPARRARNMRTAMAWLMLRAGGSPTAPARHLHGGALPDPARVTQPPRRGRAGLPRYLMTVTYPGEHRVVACHAERIDQAARGRAAGRRRIPHRQLDLQVDGAHPVPVIAGPAEVTEVARGRGHDRRREPG